MDKFDISGNRVKLVSSETTIGLFDLFKLFNKKLNIDDATLDVYKNVTLKEIYDMVPSETRWNLEEVVKIKEEKIKEATLSKEEIIDMYNTYILPIVETDDSIRTYLINFYDFVNRFETLEEGSSEKREAKELRNVIEQTILNLKELALKGEVNTIEIAIDVLKSGIKKCFDGQLSAFESIITLNVTKYKGSLQEYIKSKIILYKDWSLQQLAISEDSIENILIYTHWKYNLKEEFGYETIRPKHGIYIEAIFKYRVLILNRLLDNFNADRFVEELSKDINDKDEIVGKAMILLYEHYKNRKDIVKYFSFESQEDEEYFLNGKIKKEGVKEILKIMKIILP